MSEFPSGIKFPFQFQPAGGVGLVEGAEKVSSNLQALVLSAKRERLIRKNVGTVGYRAILRNGDHRLIGSLIKEAFQAFEPRAEKVVIEIERKEVEKLMQVYAHVRYVFKFSGEPQTLSVKLS